VIAFGIPEAARQIGVSKTVVSDLIAEGELAHCRVGRRKVVKATDLEAYLDRNRTPTDAELEALADKRGRK